jgi:hypothetical protein
MITKLFPDTTPDPNDPWKPLAPGATLFRSHRLVENGDQKLVLKQTKRSMLYKLLLLFIPGVFLFGAILNAQRDPINSGLPLLGMGLVSLAGVLYLMLGKARSKLIFDKGSGFIYKKYVLKKTEEKIYLKDVVGLQVIVDDSHIGQQKNSFTTYELHVVFKDKSKLLVLSHGSKKSFDWDVDKLAEFLNVPVLRQPKSEARIQAEETIQELFDSLGLKNFLPKENS